MKLFAALISFLVCTGCSTLSKTTNFEIEPSPQYQRTYVYDWCEENQSALGVFGEHCFGIYNPPLYSFPVDDGFLVIYPLLLSHEELSAGPLGLPIIPLGSNEASGSEEQNLYFRFRTYSKAGNFDIAPVKISISNANNGSCDITESSEDAIGKVYTCVVSLKAGEHQRLSVNLKLNNNSAFDISYVLSEFTSYRPVVAPNGPARDEKPFITVVGPDA
ncbi:hypothetical protein [Corallincola spongiicola]|uniref:Lipoprotein n=1 Tax=Corallincola spongiicola TaxID=2520508 RepID=A0ABY1WQY4_9GAMM|nr:hypothetical protein [Corallincola spongiicola]TAA47124.1 hypothetical protein EXY25_07730 [Corallincola spongiicola]